MLPDENRKVMLSKSLQLENYEEQRLMELLEIKSDPPIPNSPNSKRRFLSVFFIAVNHDILLFQFLVM